MRDKFIEVMARAGASFEEVEYDKYSELFIEQAEHMLAALDKSGLAVVPVEPTTAMLAAGMAEAGTDLASEYRAMLAASKETKK